MSEPRGYKAGLAMGGAIIEMVHIFYQNDTAAHFYRGLKEVIQVEMRQRGLFVGSYARMECGILDETCVDCAEPCPVNIGK